MIIVHYRPEAEEVFSKLDIVNYNTLAEARVAVLEMEVSSSLSYGAPWEHYLISEAPIDKDQPCYEDITYSDTVVIHADRSPNCKPFDSIGWRGIIDEQKEARIQKLREEKRLKFAKEIEKEERAKLEQLRKKYAKRSN